MFRGQALLWDVEPKHHLPMFFRDDARPAEFLQHTVPFFLVRQHLQFLDSASSRFFAKQKWL